MSQNPNENNNNKENNEDEKNNPSNIRGNAILRQELDNLTPKCDIRFALLFYNILAFLLILFGVPMLTSVERVTEIVKDYTYL